MCVVGLSPVGPLPNFPISLALSSDQSCREREGPWEPGVVSLGREAEDQSLLPSFLLLPFSLVPGQTFFQEMSVFPSQGGGVCSLEDQSGRIPDALGLGSP